MERLTVLILAAENGFKEERWESESGSSKQFVKILGESVLQRTLRLLGKYGVEAPYLLTTRCEFNDFSAVCWCPLVSTTKAHSVIASECLWAEGDVLIIYSDVYFTESAFRLIMSDTVTRFYGRQGRSAYTFKNYGEIFAIRIASADKSLALGALRKAVEHYENTGNQSFWVFHRLLSGIDVESKEVGRKYFYQIHDETDDLDHFSEVEHLVAALEKKLEWRVKYIIRRISLWNKLRRNYFRRIKVRKLIRYK